MRHSIELKDRIEVEHIDAVHDINTPFSAAHVKGWGIFDFMAPLHKRRVAHPDIRKHINEEHISSEIKKLTPFHRFRIEVGEFIEQHNVQMFILALLFLDIICLVIEFLIEFKVIGHEPEPVPGEEPKEGFDWKELEEAMVVVSIVILFIFLAEVLGLLFSFGFNFFKHPLYVLDLLVVSISLGFAMSNTETMATNMLLLLRLWRGFRIAHGIGTAAEKKFHEVMEKHSQIHEKDEEKIKRLEARVKELEKLLANKNGNENETATSASVIESGVRIHVD